jgi:circadian clock protein KaiC
MGAEKAALTGEEPRAATGLESFDCRVDGGFPRGSLILLAGNPGSGKTIFASHFLKHGAEKLGERGIYVSFAEGKEVYYQNMKSLQMDFAALEAQGLFKFLDMLAMREAGIPHLLEYIMKEAATFRADRLVLDSFSALAQAFKRTIDVRIVTHAILSKMIRRLGVTTLLVMEVPFGQTRIGKGIEEFVADGVLLFETKPTPTGLERWLRVLKMRGTQIPREPIPSDITGGGFLVDPKTTMEMEPGLGAGEQLSTGVSELDRMLGGGLVRMSTTLLVGAVGSGKTALALRFLLEGACKGQRGLMVSFAEPPFIVRRLGGQMGYSIEELEAKGLLAVHSFYPEQTRQLSYLKILQGLIDRFMPRRMVVDGVSNLAKVLPPEEYYGLHRGLVSYMRERGITGILTATSNLVDVRCIPEYYVAHMDNVIALTYMPEKGRLQKVLAVLKSCGSCCDWSVAVLDLAGEEVALRPLHGDAVGLGPPTAEVCYQCPTHI